MNPETQLPAAEKNPESSPDSRPDLRPNLRPDLRITSEHGSARTQPQLFPEPAETRFLKWMLFGPKGVRVGWSVALFLVLTFLSMGVLGSVAALLLPNVFHVKPGVFTPASAITEELLQFLGLLAAAAICALIERRRILDYNLRGPNRALHFFAGLLGGFIALTALVGALYAGGWLHLGAVSLSGIAIVRFGALWALVFLLTGLSEEGMTRCYMLFTLARGMNYWWALGSVTSFSMLALWNSHGSGSGGVYLMALLGVAPCLVLHLKKSASAGFWQAAWLTSTFFGYVHTFNKGETWVGIFSAAAIGFVFCASVRLTGSAWWAIGFHAAWDWAQTFFYGTADSGIQPTGHLLNTSPAGAAIWSGGSDGPEGSLLVIPVILFVLIVLILIYGRRARVESPSPVAQPQLS
ncbi:CPBP family intramembrane glutamic endopeptidase [Acidicapsa acidisoli]|uniref:CPBP family intramembrane glutamic endopeptidase n=1 Tax=Acidicapsa acidisoli TaxID=1615681 RepID=UPI0021E0964D|nr:type II CAAX endopeptidase family protein [Acidicapsa acidisoli]